MLSAVSFSEPSFFFILDKEGGSCWRMEDINVIFKGVSSHISDILLHWCFNRKLVKLFLKLHMLTLMQHALKTKRLM